jgi:hypothetical protein
MYINSVRDKDTKVSKDVQNDQIYKLFGYIVR